jgi:hypothetical protein
MKKILFCLLLAGCGQNALPACDCPVLPDAPDLPAPPDAAVPADLLPPRDLTAVIDLSNGDAQSAPQIFEILPNQPMRVGDTVKVLGRGLGCAHSYCSVQVGGSYASTLPGAGEDSLSFLVPSLTLPANGAYEELAIYNSAGTAHQPVTVLPAPLAPSGTLDVLWRDVDRASLDVGQPTGFHFTVRSNANQPLPVVVSATTTNGVLSPSVLDNNNYGMLAPGASRDFVVQLSPATGNAALSLNVRATAGALPGFFSATGLQVGATLPPQDFAIDLHGKAVFARSAVDDVVAVDQRGAELTITGELHDAGTWGLDAQLSSTDWSLRWLRAAPIQLTAGAADVASGPALLSQSLVVTPVVASPAPAFLTVTAQQSGATTARTLRYRLLAAE